MKVERTRGVAAKMAATKYVAKRNNLCWRGRVIFPYRSMKLPIQVWAYIKKTKVPANVAVKKSMRPMPMRTKIHPRMMSLLVLIMNADVSTTIAICIPIKIWMLMVCARFDCSNGSNRLRSQARSALGHRGLSGRIR
jgi:hypothetical protein